MVSGRRGKIQGPLRAALHNAELAERWHALGELLRYSTSLSPRQSELAILVTGRACQSPFEWYAHGSRPRRSASSLHHRCAPRATMPEGLSGGRRRRACSFADELNRFRSVVRRHVRGRARALRRAHGGGADGARRLLHDGRDDAQRARDPAARGRRSRRSRCRRRRCDERGPAGTATRTCSVPTTAFRSPRTAATRRRRRWRPSTCRCCRAWACRTACSCIQARTATTSRCCSTRCRATTNLRGVIVAASRHARHAGRPARQRHPRRPVQPSQRRRRQFRGQRLVRRPAGAGAALAAAGLHAELWTDCKALPDIAPRLRELPVRVVIDHMGGFDVAAGVDDPGFRCLLALLEAAASGSSSALIATCSARTTSSAAGRSTRRC